MARFIFKLPDIGEGISEAEIVAWHVRVGDRVEEDQQIADMMTDKATVEMESPVAGTVLELAGHVGDQVPIGAALVVIDTDEQARGDETRAEDLSRSNVRRESVPEAPQHGERSSGGSKFAVAAEAHSDTAHAMPADDAPAPTGAAAFQAAVSSAAPAGLQPSASIEATGSSTAPEAGRHALASPAVRARAADLAIDLADVKTGGDRIRHSDLDAYLRYGSAQGYGVVGAGRARPDEAIKVVGMRRRIAENMAASKRAIPHFTYVDEIDVTELERIRADLNQSRGGRPKLTMLPLLIVAICRTIPEFPMLNARYDDEAGVVTRHGAVHLGMATQTDAGLMVPVIRDAQDLSVWQLSSEIGRLAHAARMGKATRAELSGSTLTITSLGPLGGVVTTPVINRPEVAIIGPNRIIERPVLIGDGRASDQIRRAKLMNLSISCDHRVVDGWDAASFVQGLKKLLETPVLLFAER